MLTLDRLSRRFGGLSVIVDLDLAVGEGDVLGIIGPNGAGKSTLFNLIGGVLAPNGGRVLYQGRDITHMRPWHRCRMGIGRTYQILVTFGLSVIIQNGLLEVYGADTRKLSAGSLETATLTVGGGINVGVLPLLIFAAAVGMVVLLDALLYRTRTGAKIRAVADDVSAADLVGLPSPRIFAAAMAIIGVTVAVAACFMAVRTNFDPASGPSRLLVAFEAVVLGGLGSLWGTLAGSILLGVAQSVGAHIDPGSQMLAGHLLFLLVLLVRPQGLFPK
ncbi:MAG: ABC transporter permease subunit [Hyphomicrobiales bacterium]